MRCPASKDFRLRSSGSRVHLVRARTKTTTHHPFQLAGPAYRQTHPLPRDTLSAPTITEDHVWAGQCEFFCLCPNVDVTIHQWGGDPFGRLPWSTPRMGVTPHSLRPWMCHHTRCPKNESSKVDNLNWESFH